MNDSQISITSLSAERRKLLELWLEEDNLQSSGPGIPSRQTKIEFYPLSFAQQRLWILDQLLPGNPAYHETSALRLRGRLEASTLRRSLDEIIRRHEALRTTYLVVDGAPAQKINPPAPLDLPLIDLSDLAATPQETRLKELAVEQTRIPFSLSEGPLIRAKLLRLAGADHVLLLTMHHICTDGWSMGVFYREMAALYEAFSAGRPSPLAELPIQYADYAVWQRQQFQGEVLRRQLAYWSERLCGPLPQIALPTDYTAPPLPSGHGRRLRTLLPTTVAEALRDFSSRQGATLYHTLLAAFQLQLHRYTGETDIIVGSPIANRRRIETEALIGFFANTLILRTDLSGDPSFTQLVGRAKETSWAADECQDMPFERLVEELQPERRLNHNPIFQTLFVMQNTGETAGQMGHINYAAEWADGGVAKFAISLWAQERGREIELQLEYNSDLFDEATARRALGHYQRLLGSAMAEPTRRLSELEMLAEEERYEVVERFNQTRAEYPEGLCLHQLFEQQAQRAPDAVAVEAGGEQVTYAELDERAEKLARRLLGIGVGPESLVAVMVERSVRLVVALLGALKAGGAYAPLDPSYPAERLSFMLQDSEAKVLLTEQSLTGRVTAGGLQTVILDAEDETATPPTPSRRNGVSAQNLAYVIYTSGSTGRPKGAMNTHAGICNRLFWMQHAYRLTPADAVLQKTPFSFDVSVWEFFWPLMTGARLVLAEPDGHRDAAYLARIVNERRVTTAHFVPSMLGFFLEAGGAPEGGPLRRVICSGEALSFDLQERFFKLAAGTELHNLYGPTEAAVDVTYWRCRRGAVEARVPIGRPIANLRIYILDGQGEPTAVGLTGEIHIGGVGLGRGYWGRPGLTAERFVPDPFEVEPGGRLYRTGDAARWLPDGEVEYLERMDQQVKIRGFRIELGEIESVLRKHARVSEAAVAVKAGAGGDKRLVAYLVADDEGEQEDSLTPSKLREWLGRQLPDYMTPSAFVRLDSLPLTPSGKLDRKALPEPESGRLIEAVEAIAPQTRMEESVAKIWAEVFRRERVGARVNFFELGGHSLLAMQIVSRIRDAFQVDILLSHFFESPTVTGMASLIESLQREREAVMRKDLLEMLKQFSEEDLEAELIRRLPSSDAR